MEMSFTALLSCLIAAGVGCGGGGGNDQRDDSSMEPDTGGEQLDAGVDDPDTRPTGGDTDDGDGNRDTSPEGDDGGTSGDCEGDSCLPNSISSGFRFNCAVLNNATLRCWGDGERGHLGNGQQSNGYQESTPVAVQGLSTVDSVAAGDRHACAVLQSGEMRCWGDGEYGQLGHGSTPELTSTPVAVDGISTATSVSAGDGYTCAALESGEVRCWGNGYSGQLGNGDDQIEKSTPVAVEGISSATSVSVGTGHSCALLESGEVRCWGQGGYGKLGNDSTSKQTAPVAVQGISTATSISAGFRHTCALLESGAIRCWGSGAQGQLGNGEEGTDYQTSNAVDVQGISTATSVSAGRRHTCAKLESGEVRCWGQGDDGQLGHGSEPETQSTSVAVQGISTAVSVSSGGAHTCSTLSNGEGRCWGSGSISQLGSTSLGSSTPLRVNF